MALSVKIDVLTRILIAICIVAGLVAAPASFAKVVPAPVMYEGLSGVAAAVADDMPCCPKTPVLPDGTKCPLMALCASVFIGQDMAVTLALPQAVPSRRDMLADEALFAGVSGAPLPEPPRSTV